MGVGHRLAALTHLPKTLWRPRDVKHSNKMSTQTVDLFHPENYEVEEKEVVEVSKSRAEVEDKSTGMDDFSPLPNVEDAKLRLSIKPQ